MGRLMLGLFPADQLTVPWDSELKCFFPVQFFDPLIERLNILGDCIPICVCFMEQFTDDLFDCAKPHPFIANLVADCTYGRVRKIFLFNIC